MRLESSSSMTATEANWRAERTQQLLAQGLDKLDAICQVRQEAKAARAQAQAAQQQAARKQAPLL